MTLQIIVILSAIVNMKDLSHSMLSKSRYVALLWALPTPQMTLMVGLAWKLSHPVSICSL